jgi:phosphate-selective porin OprO/OprP
LAVLGIAPAAHAADAERIIVTNARLIGRTAPSEDVHVNLLIVGGKLVVVTKDELVIQPDDVAVDASAGFLLGQLVLGTRPRFVILDRDPREEFDVLLDTEAHVVFAIQDGVIVKNELPETPPSPPEATPKPRRWVAYTPPPIAVPIRYYDSRKWNKFNTKPISGLFTGALALDRQFWLSQDGNNEAQVGDLSEFEGGKIRAFRFGVVGTLNFKRPWTYTVFATTHTFDKGFDTDTDDEFTWFDYRLDIPLTADLTLSVGKQKEPISLERQTPITFLPWQERSATADADTSTQLASRVTWVPLVSKDESNLLHLGLGMRHSDAKQPVRGRVTPEFNHAPPYVDTGELPADDVITYSLEAYWRRGPYLVGFEYLGADVNSAESGDPFFHGYHLSGSWAVTGEMRTYRKRSGIFNPLPVAKPVNQGGWGTLETAFRFSRLDLTDAAVEGGEMVIYSLGLNWWLTRWAQVGVNYRFISLDRFGTEGDSSGVNARLLLMLD